MTPRQTDTGRRVRGRVATYEAKVWPNRDPNAVTFADGWACLGGSMAWREPPPRGAAEMDPAKADKIRQLVAAARFKVQIAGRCSCESAGGFHFKVSGRWPQRHHEIAAPLLAAADVLSVDTWKATAQKVPLSLVGYTAGQPVVVLAPLLFGNDRYWHEIIKGRVSA